MPIRFGKKFSKQYEAAETSIKRAFDQRLELFLQDPHHPLLNSHSLKGRYRGYQSINVTGDWRALYSEYKDDQTDETMVIFEALGTHSELYY